MTPMSRFHFCPPNYEIAYCTVRRLMAKSLENEKAGAIRKNRPSGLVYVNPSRIEFRLWLHSLFHGDRFF